MPRPRQHFEHVAVGRPRPDAADLCADGILLSVRRAARRTSLGVTTVRALVASGEWPSFTVGTRRLIPNRVVVRWAAEKLQAALESKP